MPVNLVPENSSDYANARVTVHDAEGTAQEVSRLNAVDLVRHNGYFWKAQDAYLPRPEADGPKDPTASSVTIYNLDGEETEASVANARDLVSSGAYFWNNPTLVESPEEVGNTAEENSDDSAIDLSKESLAVQAASVSDSDDVIAYLESFSLDDLKELAEERYGEKLHHRVSKETAIVKITEWEDARTAEQAD